MEEERLFDLEDGYTLFRTRALSDEIVQFLENTAFGSKDNLYRHFYIREFVAHTPRTEFYLLRNHEKELMGLVAFCRRTFMGSPPYEGAYIRYFASSPKIRGKKLISRFSKEFMQWVRREQRTPLVLFGSIEGRNKASRAIADHLGFEPFAPFKTMGFSRFRPRMKGEVHPVSAEEWKELLPKLTAFYSNHAFWGQDYLNVDGDYYVLKKDGKIVCGAQVHKAHWVVEKMMGFVGKYVLPVIPFVPFLRSIFNPRAFHFLNFEGVYVEKGQEASLIDLFESLLHIKKYHSALIWFDERDPLYQALVNIGKLGLLSRFTKNANASFIVDFSCFPEEDAKKIRAVRYCYPTGYDYT